MPLVIMTHTALERDVQQSLNDIQALSSVTEPPVLIRVEGEGNSGTRPRIVYFSKALAQFFAARLL